MDRSYALRFAELIQAEDIDAIEHELESLKLRADPSSLSFEALLHFCLSDLYELRNDMEASAKSLRLASEYAKEAVGLSKDATGYMILANALGREIENARPASAPAMAIQVRQLHEESIRRAAPHEKAWCVLLRGITKFHTPSLFGGGPGRALKDFAKSVELDPALSEGHLWMGLAHQKKGRLPEALECYSKARRTRKSFRQADILIQAVRSEMENV